jgi:hypothetical protein
MQGHIDKCVGNLPKVALSCSRQAGSVGPGEAKDTTLPWMPLILIFAGGVRRGRRDVAGRFSDLLIAFPPRYPGPGIG